MQTKFPAVEYLLHFKANWDANKNGNELKAFVSSYLNVLPSPSESQVKHGGVATQIRVKMHNLSVVSTVSLSLVGLVGLCGVDSVTGHSDRHPSTQI